MNNKKETEKNSKQFIEDQDWKIYEEGELSFDSETYDNFEKHVHGPSKGVRITDGNGRSIYIATKEEKKPKNYVPIFGLILTVIIQLVALTVFITITSERSKEVPELSKILHTVQVRLAETDQRMQTVDDIPIELRGIKSEIGNVKIALASLDTLIKRVDRIQVEMDTVQDAGAGRTKEIQTMRDQIERVTSEQDSLRHALDKASDDRFRGRDWNREKTSLQVQRENDLKLFDLRFDQLSERISAIKFRLSKLEDKQGSNIEEAQNGRSGYIIRSNKN